MDGSLTTTGLPDLKLITRPAVHIGLSAGRHANEQKQRDKPLFELLINGHQLDILILLHIVPGGRISLGPDDYKYWIQCPKK